MSQASVVMPNSGIVSGLTFANDVNAGLDAIRTSWAGATAPSADAPEEGQRWLDTSIAGFVTLKLYDGTSWVPIYTVNTTTHLLASLLAAGNINVGLTASVGSGILTVNLTDVLGNTPSAQSPVLLPFRNVTLATGLSNFLTISAALSIDTNAIGATLGTTNNIPFRFWIVVFNDSGTAKMALFNASPDGTLIAPLVESSVQSSTAMSATATSANTFYTENGIAAVVNQPFCIIGYLEYSSGLATAGNYASGPTKLQLFMPGNKLPNDVVQRIRGGSGVTSVPITPTSVANRFRVAASGYMTWNGSANMTTTLQLRRGTTVLATEQWSAAPGSPLATIFAFEYMDTSTSISASTYNLSFSGSTGAISGAFITLEEVMG